MPLPRQLTIQERTLDAFLAGELEKLIPARFLLRECNGDATDAFELAKEHSDFLATHPRGRGHELNCDTCRNSSRGYTGILCRSCYTEFTKWQAIAISLRSLVVSGYGTTELAEASYQRRSGWCRSQIGQQHRAWIVGKRFESWEYWDPDEIT